MSATTAALTNPVDQSPVEEQFPVENHIPVEDQSSVEEQFPVENHTLVEDQSPVEKQFPVEDQSSPVPAASDIGPTVVSLSPRPTTSLPLSKMWDTGYWYLREVAVLSHTGQILWLCCLTGTVCYILAATVHQWRATVESRRALA